MVIKINVLYRFEGFEIDPVNRVFKGAGKPIFLHSRTFDLMLYMVRNGGRLLAKEELMGAVWGDAAVEEGNLTQGVFLLRKALGASRPDGGKMIVTVPARGYRFEAAVEEIDARGSFGAEELPKAAPPVAQNPSRQSRRPRRKRRPGVEPWFTGWVTR